MEKSSRVPWYSKSVQRVPIGLVFVRDPFSGLDVALVEKYIGRSRRVPFGAMTRAVQ